MPELSAEFSDGFRRTIAAAPSFAVDADGAVFAVDQHGHRNRLLRFRPGMSRLGQPRLRDGAWYRGPRKLVDVHISTDDGPFELYGDGMALSGPRQAATWDLELGSMEGSLPYLWNEKHREAVAEVNAGYWIQPGTDSASFSCREILFGTADTLPPSWTIRPAPRLRLSVFAG